MLSKTNFQALFIAILIVNSISCSREQPKDELVPIAKVNDKILYKSDILHIFNKNQTPGDSVAITQSYIENWIKTQLLLKKAELNLSEDQLDISKQLEAYRSSLLIYKYEELMMREKVDTVVTKEDIEKYYSENNSNFILDENLIKGLYVKMPLSAPENENLKKWYKSEVSQDIKSLEKYCYAYANKYSNFDEDWISFAIIQNLLPQTIENEDIYLKENRLIEKQDNEYIYLVKLRDIKPKGSVAPIEYVKGKVKDIIINKRKLNFVSELEKNIYNDAADHSNFKIYNLDKK